MKTWFYDFYYGFYGKKSWEKLVRVFETLVFRCFFLLQLNNVSLKLILTSSNRVVDRNKAIYSVNRVMTSNDIRMRVSYIFTLLLNYLYFYFFFLHFAIILNLINVIEKRKWMHLTKDVSLFRCIKLINGKLNINFLRDYLKAKLKIDCLLVQI